MIKQHEHKFLVRNNGSAICYDCDLQYSQDEILYILTELSKQAQMKYYQHGDTGRTCATIKILSGDWYEITKEQYDQHYLSLERKS